MEADTSVDTMALRLASRTVPLLHRQGARTMMSGVGSYRVPEFQKMMQENTDINFSDNPTYLKRKESDKGFAIFGLLFSSMGVLYALKGHFHMARGTNKID